ncbi:DnaD domain protein, partial [Enterococcus durans]
RGRTKAGIYLITDLTGNFTAKKKVIDTVENPATGNITVNSKVNPKVNREVNPSVDSTVNPSAYINNTKQDNTNKEDEDDLGVYEFIQISWGKPPTGLLQGALGSFIQSWGSKMILYAFQLAYENGVEMHGLKKYVVTILNSWTRKGIDTIEKAKLDQENFKQQRKTNYTKPKNVRREKLPDWVNKPQEEQKIDPEKKAEIDARFEAYFSRTSDEKEGASN